MLDILGLIVIDLQDDMQYSLKYLMYSQADIIN